METALYLPVKTFLEAAGYPVKDEIGGCDPSRISEGEPPCWSLRAKLTFNLKSSSRRSTARPWPTRCGSPRASPQKGKGRDLCRRVGFGMLGVSDAGTVDIIVSAVSPKPRTNPKRRSRLMQEHKKRRGDPTLGGSTRAPLMTAYRQQALACASALPKDRCG